MLLALCSSIAQYHSFLARRVILVPKHRHGRAPSAALFEPLRAPQRLVRPHRPPSRLVSFVKRSHSHPHTLYGLPTTSSARAPPRDDQRRALARDGLSSSACDGRLQVLRVSGTPSAVHFFSAFFSTVTLSSGPGSHAHQACPLRHQRRQCRPLCRLCSRWWWWWWWCP